MNRGDNTKQLLNDAIIKDIRDAVESITDGGVYIQVRGQKIIQIDVAKRRRFDEIWNIQDGAGI